MPSPIDTLYQDGVQLYKLLVDRNEISLASSIQSIQSKVLLLSTASSFEFRLSEAMRGFASVHSSKHPGIEGVVKAKAIERQYHTWFNWKDLSAGSFYKLFGECGASMKQEICSDKALKDGEKAFLSLGQTRNELVHENFITFPLTKTAEEIYAEYQKADLYVQWIEQKITAPTFGRP